jgi:hypothetical protein
MPVAAPHLFYRVADDVVDDPLVDARRRQARNHRVEEHMQAAYDCPSIALAQHPLDMVVAFGGGQRRRRRSILTQSDGCLPALQRGGPLLAMKVGPVVRLRFLLCPISPAWQNNVGPPG